MDQMNWFELWFYKPLAELSFSLLIFGIFVIFLCLKRVPKIIKQRRCSHDSVFENMACNAICRSCRKNLGFIQNWRDSRTTL